MSIMKESSDNSVVMKGNGHYNNNSSLQATNITYVKQLIPLVIKSFLLSDSSPNSCFTIIDYGSSQGANSLPVISEFISQIRFDTTNKYLQLRAKSITVIHQDQAANDWISLFDTVRNNRNTYLKTSFDNLYYLACGRSFYDCVVPPSSVDFCYSSIAFHWLSKVPCQLSNEYHITGPNATDEERSVWKECARVDWLTILQNRSQEVKPGGICLFVMSARDSNNKTGFELVYQHIRDVFQSMIKEGIITQAEFSNCSSPSYSRNQHELLDEDILRVTGFECLYYKEWKAENNPIYIQYKSSGDLKQFGESFVNMLRSAGESTLLKGFDGDSSTKSKKVDMLYERLKTLLLQSPDNFNCMRLSSYVILRRLNKS